MKFPIICTFCTMLIALVSGCGNDSEVVVIEQTEEMIELSVKFSIGAETGDSTEAFGSITDACHDTAGRILVLDQTLCGVPVFSNDGEYICQIGRSGAGPGEFLMPLYVAGLNDGRILVHDPMSNAFVSYDSSFSYIENISLWDNGPPLETCAVAESCYAGIVLGFDMETDQPMIVRSLAKYSVNREPDMLYFEDEVPFDFSDFTSVLSNMMFSFSLTGDSFGRFFYSPTSSETYEVFAFNHDGSELFHISRDLPRVEKTEQEMEDEIIYIESWANRIGMQGVVIEWEPDPYRTFIKALGVDSAERLWVVRGTELEPVFDVFDMSGTHLFSARLPVESGSWKFHIDSFGILGWEEDPPDGFQKLYIIDFPAVS
ncbi:MAG: 6-bladed beta-propeller [Candidatus Aegiribacteria sp.]|nr:6-bladed beta-propeller [Candidatus Aegiribacteria sp.]